MSFDTLQSGMDMGADAYKGKYFLGKVVKNDDPENLGRIQVDIPGLYDPNSGDLPWAGPVKYSSFGQGETWGVYGSPAIGSDVIILLQDGNPHYPLYHTVQAYPNGSFESGGKSWGFLDPYGNRLKVQEDKTITFVASAGVTIKITPAGDLEVTTKGDLKATIGGNVNAAVTGNVTATVGGNLESATSGNSVISSGGTMSFSSGGPMSFTAPRVDWN